MKFLPRLKKLGLQMMAYKDVLSTCGLQDLGYCGYKYTWHRGTAMARRIVKRLDLALASWTWMEIFPYSTLFHLTFVLSNHYLIMLEFNSPNNVSKLKHKLLRFENWWLNHNEPQHIIKKYWRA